jgi:iron complex outermembrane recepter protein
MRSEVRGPRSEVRGPTSEGSWRWTRCCLIASIAVSVPLSAQDTTRTSRLDTIVVTAERAPATLGTVSTAVSRLDAAQLARLPRSTFADVLRLVPGFSLVDFDGLARDPQLMVRGFYGGGEAEYVVVLVDGKPVSQLATGLVSWDALPPPETIAAVEVVRGSASALYGDAALGAVINIITRPDASSPLRWTLAGGSLGTWRANAGGDGTLGDRAFTLSGAFDRTDGYRVHAERSSHQVAGDLTLVESDRGRLKLAARSHWRDFDEPGALLESLRSAQHDASDALYRFDHTEDREQTLSVDGERIFGGVARWSGSIAGAYRSTDAVRTLALAPGFGDTKARDSRTTRISATTQLHVTETPLPGDDHLTVGLDATLGDLESKYFAVLTGDRDSYLDAEGERGELDARGDLSRVTAAMFAQYTLQLAPAVRFSLGGRFDRIKDERVPRAPSDDERVSATHDAFSPKVGVNVRYVENERASGNVYVTASRSFKTPTLDQLFDQRTIPVPFPPFAISTSNPSLSPQRGAGIELGIHQAMAVGSGRLTATANVYHLDMKNELDFDVENFRYVNIGRSRHRGLELGLTADGGGSASAFGNYSLQSVTARSGEFTGNALKAIPKHVASLGSAITVASRLDLRLVASHTRGMFLDDANSEPLDDYTRVDAHVGYRLGALDVFVDVSNLFDARYSTTGFPDPAGTGEAYFYPAAERTLLVGFRRGR